MAKAKSKQIQVVTGAQEYFKGVGVIPYVGPEKKKKRNPLAFRWYNANKEIQGRSMRNHLRFALAWWHTLGGTGADPFGLPTKQFPWLTASDPVQQAKEKMDAGFELITKLGLPFYCFHDYDLIAEGDSLKESTKRLEVISDYALAKQKDSE
jgi:xylose isomerase